MTKTLQLLAEDPTVSPNEIASLIGRSRRTVYDYFEELLEGGKISRNGTGFRVIG